VSATSLVPAVTVPLITVDVVVAPAVSASIRITECTMPYAAGELRPYLKPAFQLQHAQVRASLRRLFHGLLLLSTKVCAFVCGGCPCHMCAGAAGC
jgi:hypothetical protein